MKKYLLLSISLFLLLLTVLAVPGKDYFRLEAGEIIERVSTHRHIITADQMKKIQEKEDVVLMDLRSRGDYSVSNLPGSINFPLKELTIKSIRDYLAESGNYILYSEETHTACNVWILLTQMGYKNIWVLEAN